MRTPTSMYLRTCAPTGPGKTLHTFESDVLTILSVFEDAYGLGDTNGQAYMNYGIDDGGAFVVVRPDGYVALTASLNDVASLDRYFGNFLKRIDRSTVL